MVMKKMKLLILLCNYQDLIGVDVLECWVMKDFVRWMNKIGKVYKLVFNKIFFFFVVNVRYEYQLNLMLFFIILNDVSYLVDQVLFEGGDYDLWFYEYIDLVLEKGIGQLFYNFSQ